LTGKEKHLFLDFVNAHGGVNAITAIENFIIGFRLGVRIGIEVMDNEDGMLQDIKICVQQAVKYSKIPTK